MVGECEYAMPRPTQDFGTHRCSSIRSGPLWVCLVVAIVFISACQERSPAGPTDEPPGAGTGFVSGGIGLRRTDLVGRFGPLKNENASSGFSDIGVDKSAFVAFAIDRVRFIEVHLPSGSTSEDEARSAALAFLPHDSAHLGRSTECRACRFWVTSDRFISDSLAQLDTTCTPTRQAGRGEVILSIQHATGARSSPAVLVDLSWACDWPK